MAFFLSCIVGNRIKPDHYLLRRLSHLSFLDGEREKKFMKIFSRTGTGNRCWFFLLSDAACSSDSGGKRERKLEKTFP
jgi:hypothetical protein